MRRGLERLRELRRKIVGSGRNSSLADALRRELDLAVQDIEAGSVEFAGKIRGRTRMIRRIGKAADATERQQTEQALDESRARLAGIVASAMDAIVTIDADQRIVLFNEAAETMLGCPAGEALGCRLDRFIPERFRATHPQDIARFGQTRRSKRSMGGQRQVYGLRANGEEFPIEASISQIEVGGRTLFTVVLRDISGRIKAEQAILESNERFQAIFSGMSDAAVFTNPQHRILLVNRAFTTTFGYSFAEASGRSTEFLYADSADYHRLAGRPVDPADELSAAPFEVRYRRKDGSTFWSESGRGAIRRSPDAVIGYLELHRDITQRKADEAALARTNEELEQRVVVRTTALLNEIAERRRAEQQIRELSMHLQGRIEDERIRIARELHDELGAALTAIRMHLSLVAEETEQAGAQPLADRLREMTAEVDATIAATRRIYSDLRPSLLDNLGLWAAIEWQAEDVQRRTGIRCRAEFEGAELELDPQRSIAVFRIVQEALTNAIRHAGASTLRVRADVGKDEITVEVSDDGRGIRPEELGREKSFGIVGMQERARALGGSVQVQGSAQGTRVTVRMPLAAEPT